MAVTEYKSASDVVIQGTYILPITIEDLVRISKIIENDNFIKCIVDKEKFVELYFKRCQRDGERKEADECYKYFQEDGDAVVRNVYFNVNTKQFEVQLLKLVFE
jgi:hypothetical protein